MAVFNISPTNPPASGRKDVFNSPNNPETLDSNDKPITIVSGNNKVHITSNNVEINSDNISLGGSFEVLYNLIPNTPIADVSQIGVSKKVKIG